MQLVAAVLLVNVHRRDDVGHLQAVAMQLVGIVRHINLPFADKFPVVTVDPAVEHVELVTGAHAVRRRAGVIVSDLRRAAHAAHRRQARRRRRASARRNSRSA